MIIEEIKAASIEALKNKNQNLRNIYSIVINKYMQAQIEARLKKEEVSDEDMVGIIQKTIKELIDEAKNFELAGNPEEVKKINEQREAIEKYLPQMLTAQEIHTIIESLPDKSIPGVMRHFKLTYANRVDMKMVSDELKNF